MCLYIVHTCKCADVVSFLVRLLVPLLEPAATMCSVFDMLCLCAGRVSFVELPCRLVSVPDECARLTTRDDTNPTPPPTL